MASVSRVVESEVHEIDWLLVSLASTKLQLSQIQSNQTRMKTVLNVVAVHGHPAVVDQAEKPRSLDRQDLLRGGPAEDELHKAAAAAIRRTLAEIVFVAGNTQNRAEVAEA